MPTVIEAELIEAAMDLALWAAAVNWDGKRNTRAWLAGLKARVERVQTLYQTYNPMRRGMPVDENVLPDECKLDERRRATGGTHGALG